MWSGRVFAVAILGAAMLVTSRSEPSAADGFVLKPEVAAPMKVALNILDGLCAGGTDDACSGAQVLRMRQAALLRINAQCARGNADACMGLVTAGYELEALALAVARQAALVQVAGH